MTFHSKAATDEVYNMFNQPTRQDTSRDESDEDDDAYSTAGESTGTGRISGTTSEFGDEDTMASIGTTADENTRTGSQPDSVSPWSEFTASKHVPKSGGRTSRNTMGEEVTENLSSSQNQTQTSQLSAFDTQAIAAIAGQQISDLDTQVIAAMAGDFGEDEEEQGLKTPLSPTYPEEIEIPNKPKYVPLPPEDYEPTPLRPFRDPEAIAQNRLPFMTPIVEKTESSLAPSTVFDDKEPFGTKTPSHTHRLAARPNENSPSRLRVNELLLESPIKSPSPHKRKLSAGGNDLERLTSSPQKLKSKFTDANFSNPRTNPQPEFGIVTKPAPPKFGSASNADGINKALPAKGPIVLDVQCNPVHISTREQILNLAHPPLLSYAGYHDRSSSSSGRYSQIQSFAKKVMALKPKSSPRKSQNEKTLTQAVQPLLEFPGSSRVYAIKRELGKGAFAPVYLVDSYDRDADEDTDTQNQIKGSRKRDDLEAVKTEDPPSAWEFYILRLVCHRLGHMSRTMQSIILAHECHVFQDECYLVLEYRSQGTLLDLVNTIKEENRKAGRPADAGLDEVLAMFLSVELLRTMEACHAVGVIHGDLKADNCLARFDYGDLTEPYQRDGTFGWENKGLTFIDFGRGIDFKAFKPEVQFIADWPSSPQDCAEIREARPWTWQIDYFGAAGVIHSLLFGKYIETVAVGGGAGPGQKKEWKLKDGFKRYWQQDIWGNAFTLLLNPGLAGEAMPCIESLKRVRGEMEAWLEEEGERKGLRGQIRKTEGLMNAKKR